MQKPLHNWHIPTAAAAAPATISHDEVLWLYFPSRTLIHLPLVSQKCVGKLDQHWLRQWIVANSAPSHYLNQWSLTINWTLRNNIQWNLNQNTRLVFHRNGPENVDCEMAAIFSRGRWVDICAESSSTSDQITKLIPWCSKIRG